MNSKLNRRLGLGKTLMSVLFLLFLTACPSTDGEQKIIENLSGIWIEGAAFSTICSGEHTAFSLIEFDLDQSADQVSGDVSLTNLNDGVQVTGKFTGLQEGDNLTGRMNFSNRYGESVTWDVDLEVSDVALEGELIDRAEETCPYGVLDRWRTEVTLLRKLPDPAQADSKEPNNVSKQATLVNPEDSFKLSLPVNDIDWFKFDLSKTSEVQFDITLLSAMGFRAYILKESEVNSQLVAMLEADPKALSTQSNLWSLKAQLAPGSYYLVITGLADEGLAGEHQDNGNYQLDFVKSTVVPDADTEPNDSFEQARPIALDFTEEGYMGAQDEDWFSFTLTESQRVDFSLTAGPEFAAALYDANRQQIFSSYIFSSEPVSRNLGPGQYFLQLERNIFVAAYYTLTIKAVSLPDADLEPNNTRETASPITLDYSGTSFITYTDEDWYTFTLTENRLVTFDFTNTNSFEAQLYNAENNIIFSLYYSDSKLTRSLVAGTYYLQLRNAYEQLIPLSITSTALPDRDIEPNNSFNKATPISLPFSHLVYTSSGDEDWYTFTISSDRLVSYTLSNDQTYAGEVTLNVVDDIGQSITFVGTAPSINNKPVTNYLRAGSYYLRIFGDTSIQYTLDIDSEALTDTAFEPNNSLGEAYTIPVGFNQKDLVVFASSNHQFNDTDFFRLTLSKTIQLDMLVTQQSGGFGLNIAVADMDGNHFHSIYPDEPTDRIFPPGTYFFVISSYGSDNSAMKYSLSVLEK
jgi:hypothetical protein